MQPHKYFYIDQAVLHLGQDWADDYDGVYEATEDWIQGLGERPLRQLIAEIDVIRDVEPSLATRQAMFHTVYAFHVGDGSFDTWLQALHQRAIEALAGIHSNPLTDPPSHVEGSGRH